MPTTLSEKVASFGRCSDEALLMIAESNLASFDLEWMGDESLDQRPIG